MVVLLFAGVLVSFSRLMFVLDCAVWLLYLCGFVAFIGIVWVFVLL